MANHSMRVGAIVSSGLRRPHRAGDQASTNICIERRSASPWLRSAADAFDS
jgi:hypothetical protein